MKKLLCHVRVFSILAYIVLGVLISCLLFHSCKKPVKIDTVELAESSIPLSKDFIFIPVSINDSVYRFLFDTGSNSSAIDSVYAKKIGLYADGTSLAKISNMYRTVEDSVSFARKNISIGQIRTTGIFFLDQYKGLAIENNPGAIMGMDIGRQYNWLFNFDDNTATLSKNRITIPILPDDQIFTLNFYYNDEFGNTQMNLTMDDVIIQNVVFDTGYSDSWDVWDKEKKIDIVFSESDFEIVRSSLVKNLRCYNSMDFSAMGLGRSLIIDSLKIDDLIIPGIFAIERKEKARSAITIHFVRRFRMMYYDSMNKKIELYVSHADSVRYQRIDLQNFVRTIIQHYNENRGDMSTLTTSKLMELW